MSKRTYTKNISTNRVRKLRKPLVLDLFAGAGGLSEGFYRAGCEIVGHLEMDQNACDTLITRGMFHELKKKGLINEYKRYVKGKISRDEIIEKYGLEKVRDSVICAKVTKSNCINLITKFKHLLGKKKLDFVVGGPPCQAYSYIGRARDKHGMTKDERNYLYKIYVAFLRELKPKMFVFENVPGLISAGSGKYLKNMRILMKKAGYETGYDIQDASEFGVPQNRKRVIIVGWNNEVDLREYPKFRKVKRNYLVKDFLLDLPSRSAGGGKINTTFKSKKALLSKLHIVDGKFDILMDHVARAHKKQDLEIYKRAVLEKSKGINLKYNKLPKSLKSHNNETGFLDRFKVVDGEAIGSQTIVAHIAKDGHYYIHPSLTQNRSLTVREAARLQTFPDDYMFEGTRGSRYKQIGNAVPPMLAWRIAKEIIKYI